MTQFQVSPHNKSSSVKTTLRGPILENNGMLLSIEKKKLFVKKVACHDFRE
jgi:hypothetical protein